MWATAFVLSGVAAVIVTIALATFETSSDDSPWPSLCTGLIYFIVMVPATVLYLYKAAPTLNAGGYFTMVIFYSSIGAAFGLAKHAITPGWDWPYGTTILGVLLVVLLIGGMLTSWFAGWGQDTADRLAGKVKVTKEGPGTYPETDTEHISLVPLEAAKFKAEQALTQTDDKNTNISTSYEIGDGSKQSIDGHLYWVFMLNIGGDRAQKRNNYTVPGYVVVDAEDPSASSKLKLGYKIKVWPGGRADHSLKRLIWEKFPDRSFDDLNLEINDDWEPYYTVSLDEAVYTFGPRIPSSMAVINAQTSELTEYKLGAAPAWVDRVYSADAAKLLMGWWGRWGAGEEEAPWRSGLPWAKEGKSNRFKVNGEPNLVYTTDKDGSYPEWQMLLSSMKSDSAAVYVALFDARDASVRLYRVPNLQTEDTVVKTFETSPGNVKKYKATEPALHLIYGRLTWVTTYINEKEEEDGKQNQSIQAFGLVAADATQGSDVQYAQSKSAVFDDYQEWLAGSKSPDDPTAESKKRTAEGTVEHFSSVVREGDTSFYIILKEEPTRVFRGKMDGETTELSFTKPGNKVRITYSDTAEDIVLITAFDDLELLVGQTPGG